jgi:hypothetical protein
MANKNFGDDKKQKHTLFPYSLSSTILTTHPCLPTTTKKEALQAEAAHV